MIGSNGDVSVTGIDAWPSAERHTLVDGLGARGDRHASTWPICTRQMDGACRRIVRFGTRAHHHAGMLLIHHELAVREPLRL